MSEWLHVSGIFRIDKMGRTLDCTTIFGKVCNNNDEVAVAEFEKNPDRFLPCGSEGSLQMSVWESNAEDDCVNSYTVSVFGDLRDCAVSEDEDTMHYVVSQDIIDWFLVTLRKLKCEHWSVRQAVITIDDDDGTCDTATLVGNSIKYVTYYEDDYLLKHTDGVIALDE